MLYSTESEERERGVSIEVLDFVVFIILLFKREIGHSNHIIHIN